MKTPIQKLFNENYGISGNDDSGAMLSWFAFHMMGLYSNAIRPYY